MQKEIEKWLRWRDTGIEVSNLGRVRRGDMLYGLNTRDRIGHIRLTFELGKLKHSVYLHRLVADCWLPAQPAPDYVIVHIDGNRDNCSARNLMWAPLHYANRANGARERRRESCIQWYMANSRPCSYVGKYGEDGRLAALYPNCGAAARANGIDPVRMRRAVRRGYKINGLVFAHPFAIAGTMTFAAKI